MGRPGLLNINIGDEFGDLKCIAIIPKKEHTFYRMKCKICGREKDMLSATIAYKHGITHKACGKGLKTKDKIFYERWQSMRQRTTNPNLEHADCYINRGINSDEFENFIDFYDKKYESFLEKAKEIGKKNTSLERIDPNLDYTSENTMWIHKNQQQQNCRKTIDFAVEYPDGNIEIHRCLGKFITEYNNNPEHKIKLDYETALDCMNNKITNHRGLKFIRLKPGIESIK